MPKILQLPPNVVAKIAAGEVVERPASVVKELVENSLDAGATRIDIDLEQGGLELIRVVDDGGGMAAEDLPLAFAPHATSKLRTAEDLFDLGTMGFRGEALASIAGVGQVLLQSRQPEDSSGHEIRCRDSVLTDLRPWGGSPGTRIEVKHLFYSIPARKAFLKSAATELGHVSEVVTRLALANSHVHFSLKHNGKKVFELPAMASLKERLGLFFGGEVFDALYELDTGPGTPRLKGYIADPKCDRGNPKWQYFFANGRWFRDRSLGHAAQEAYRGLLMTGRYAVFFLFLEVAPNTLDVNVHPQKHEVRFREQSLIYSLVRSAVKARLTKENLIPQLRAPEPSEVEPFRPVPDLFSPRSDVAQRSFAPWDRAILPPEATPPKTVPVESKEEVASAPIPELPFLLPSLPPGSALQLHDAYIVLETNEGMLVIDQHALHERILYEQLRQRIRDGKLEVQRLLIPEAIDLPAEQCAAVLEARDALRELGLDVSDFGGNTILLSSYPTLLSRREPAQILKAAVDHLTAQDRAPPKEVLLDHLMATMACKAAVKAGDRLTPEEIAHLLMLREMAEDSHHCPHGRPTSLLFSRQQLDKQFGRT